MFILQEEKFLQCDRVDKFLRHRKVWRMLFLLSVHSPGTLGDTKLVNPKEFRRIFNAVSPPCFGMATQLLSESINMHYRDKDVSKLSNSLLPG